MIESGDLVNLEAFGERNDRVVGRAERQVRVLSDELGPARQVRVGEINELEAATEVKNKASTRAPASRASRYPVSAITVAGASRARPARCIPVNNSTLARWSSSLDRAAATNGRVSQRITLRHRIHRRAVRLLELRCPSGRPVRRRTRPAARLWL